jgi:hypothetical protein
VSFAGHLTFIILTAYFSTKLISLNKRWGEILGSHSSKYEDTVFWDAELCSLMQVTSISEMLTAYKTTWCATPKDCVVLINMNLKLILTPKMATGSAPSVIA